MNLIYVDEMIWLYKAAYLSHSSCLYSQVYTRIGSF